MIVCELKSQITSVDGVDYNITIVGRQTIRAAL